MREKVIHYSYAYVVEYASIAAMQQWTKAATDALRTGVNTKMLNTAAGL